MALRFLTAGESHGPALVAILEEAVERRIFYVPEPFRLVVDVARGSNAIGMSCMPGIL